MLTHYPDPKTVPTRKRGDRTAEYKRRNEKKSQQATAPQGRPPLMQGAYKTLCDLKQAGCVHFHQETGEPFILVYNEANDTAYPILCSALVGLSPGAVNYLTREANTIKTVQERRAADNEERLANALAIMGGR